MLQDAAKTANGTSESIASGLTRLLQGVEEVQGSFKGRANDALQSVSADLGNELRQILEALNHMAGAVDSSAAIFGDTDEAANQEITKVATANGDGGVASILRG